MNNDPFRRPIIVKARGLFWWWRGLADADGRYHLSDPFDDKRGILVEPQHCLIIRGAERVKQIAAIDAERKDRMEARKINNWRRWESPS